MTGGFVLGEVLFLQGVVRHPGVVAVILPVTTLVLWFLISFVAGRSSNQLRPAFVWLFFAAGAAGAAAGLLRAEAKQQWIGTELALGLDGRQVTVTGILQEALAGSAGGSGSGQNVLLLRDCTVAQGDSGGRLERLQVYTDGDITGYKLGNCIQAAGKVSVIVPATNPGQFDYQMYYRSRQINYRMAAREVVVVNADYNRYSETLRRFRERAGQTLSRVAGADAGFYQAMVLGDKSGLDETAQQLYQRNGISHLFAISGLHMSLIGMGLYRLIRRTGAGFGLSGLIGAALVVSYVAMIGTTASVVRALVMLLAAFGAAYLGRTYDLLSALALAVLLILWDSPYQLYQAGFQLSAGAVLGVGALVPVLERLCSDTINQKTHLWIWRVFKICRQGLIAGIGIQLATLPLLLYHFFQFPLYSIFLNPIVIPLMSGVVISGLAGIVLGGIAPAAGVFAVGAGHYILQYYEWICRIFAALPGSTLVWGRPQLWQVAVYYFVVILSLCLTVHFQLKRLAIVTLAACLLLYPLPVRGLSVTFLDVGQGDGIVMQTRNHTILVDGGSSSVRTLGENRLEPFLKSNAAMDIDYAFVTHADTDHISGLIYLLESGQDIRIRNLLLPVSGQQDEAYEQLVGLMRQRGGTVHWIAQGYQIRDDNLSVTCLYPGSGDLAPDRNAHSLVLKVDYGSFHMLLTGDMGEAQELTMLTREAVRNQLAAVQVLKVAHHGSRMSSSEALLQTVSPVWAVVSYGADNSYGHPHEEVRERLAEQGVILFETAKSGAVRLETDGKGIRWVHFRDQHPGRQ